MLQSLTYVNILFVTAYAFPAKSISLHKGKFTSNLNKIKLRSDPSDVKDAIHNQILENAPQLYAGFKKLQERLNIQVDDEAMYKKYLELLEDAAKNFASLVAGLTAGHKDAQNQKGKTVQIKTNDNEGPPAKPMFAADFSKKPHYRPLKDIAFETFYDYY